MLVSDPGVLAAGWVDRAVPHLADVRVRVAPVARPDAESQGLRGPGGVRELPRERLRRAAGDRWRELHRPRQGGGDPQRQRRPDPRLRGHRPGHQPDPADGDGPDDRRLGIGRVAVLRDHRHQRDASRRRSEVGALVPEISLTDPELLTTMSAELTAHTGIDALSHAIESLGVRGLRLPEQGPRDRRDRGDRRAPSGGGRGSARSHRARGDGARQPAGRDGVLQRAARRDARDRPPDRRCARPPARAAQRDPAAARHALQRRDPRRPLCRRGPGRSASQTDGLDARTRRRAGDRARRGRSAEPSASPSGLQRDRRRSGRLRHASRSNALRDAYIATNPRPVSEDDVRRICIAAY